MFDVKITLVVEQFESLIEAIRRGLTDVAHALDEGLILMSDSTEQLTTVANAILVQVATLTTAQQAGMAALQTEIAAISAALSQVDAPAVAAAVAQLTHVQTGLAALQTKQEEMTATIQNIVP